MVQLCWFRISALYVWSHLQAWYAKYTLITRIMRLHFKSKLKHNQSYQHLVTRLVIIKPGGRKIINQTQCLTMFFPLCSGVVVLHGIQIILDEIIYTIVFKLTDTHFCFNTRPHQQHPKTRYNYMSTCRCGGVSPVNRSIYIYI